MAPVGSPATIQWQTTQPYESAVLVRPGASLRLENINVRHSSPSVANNYSVFCQEGKLEAVACDISSASGSGIGIEGGAAVLSDCQIRNCKLSGAVVAGALFTSEAQEVDVAATKVRPSHIILLIVDTLLFSWTLALLYSVVAACCAAAETLVWIRCWHTSRCKRNFR